MCCRERAAAGLGPDREGQALLGRAAVVGGSHVLGSAR